MERLTERNPLWINDEMWLNACEPDDEEIESVYHKLKEYEDLEEQGRLVKLPCKVGDTVWKVEEGLEHTYIERLVIDRIEVNDSYIYYFADEKITGKSVILDDCDFSKTVFLTKSEAEAKLKELRGEENGSME